MILLFYFFIVVSLGLITTDTGFFLGFDDSTYSSFSCKNGFNKSSTQTFSGTFANPPQIILTIEKHDQYNSNQTNQFNIQNITVSKFDFYVICYSGQLVSSRIRWFAIDDQRIQVINKFDQTSLQNYTISHQNPNVVAGFISLFAISYIGALNFYINISQLTPTNVTIQINNPNAKSINLKSLSYQIILVSPETTKISDIFNLTSNFQSSDITLSPNTFFMIATSGYIYQYTTNFRLNVTYQTLNPIRYTLVQWEGTFSQNTNRQIQLSYSFTPYLLLKCDNIRVSQRNDLNMVTQPSIVFNIINMSYSTIGTFSQIIDKSLSNIKLEIQVRCQAGKKITSQFYMYPENIGQLQMKTLQHYCFNESSLKVFQPRFTQQMSAYEELTISITNTGCQMSQVLYNQVKTTNALLNLQIVDA